MAGCKGMMVRFSTEKDAVRAAATSCLEELAGERQHAGERHTHLHWLLCSGTDSLHRAPMAEKQVVATESQLIAAQFHLGRHDASLGAEAPQDVGLINREPVCDAVRKSADNQMSIVGKPLGTVRVQPSSLLLQRVWIIEVEDGGEWP